MGMEAQSRMHLGQITQSNLYGGHENAGRTREEEGNIFMEALRRQLECRARDKRICGVQHDHDERFPSLEEKNRQAWAPVFIRVDTISYKQIHRRTVTPFLTWRPISEIDAAEFRRGWDDGAT
jgi:hypothetical protein